MLTRQGSRICGLFSMAKSGRPLHRDVWAIVPIKETEFAKQRLAKALSPGRRQELVVAMFEDVMQALSASHGLAGIAVVTLDQNATQIAARWGAQVWTDGARDGHTGAVAAAARRLAETGSTMLTIPGDVPRVSPVDIAAILAAHTDPPAFTIVPAWDDLGSNAIMCSPPDLVPLRFGPDSFFPHLAAARRQGLRADHRPQAGNCGRYRRASRPRQVHERSLRYTDLGVPRPMPSRMGCGRVP